MPNPLINQGSLNRVRASIVWSQNPALNVTSSYLGKQGIKLALEGESTLFIPSMTGQVTSPEPYMSINLTINLLKPQALPALYKAKMETNALLGDGTVRPDAIALPPYAIVNCAIQSIRELDFNGEDAGFVVNIRGYYLVNSILFD